MFRGVVVFYGVFDERIKCGMEQCPMCENINNTICIDECDAMCYVIGSG